MLRISYDHRSLFRGFGVLGKENFPVICLVWSGAPGLVRQQLKHLRRWFRNSSTSCPVRHRNREALSTFDKRR